MILKKNTPIAMDRIIDVNDYQGKVCKDAHVLTSLFYCNIHTVFLKINVLKRSFHSDSIEQQS